MLSAKLMVTLPAHASAITQVEIDPAGAIVAGEPYATRYLCNAKSSMTSQKRCRAQHLDGPCPGFPNITASSFQSASAVVLVAGLMLVDLAGLTQ